MKISEAWLREWVNPGISTQELAEQLTMAGLEVDAIQPVAGEFSGVVVAEIVSTKPHPDADKLQVCEVNNGSETVQIVCGATNARAGIKVPLAKVGAVLPGSSAEETFKIKKAKLRGVESQGMLCAQTELKAGDDDSGLWELPQDAPAGANLQEYLQLKDNVIEVDLTPNRGDCFSVRGVAREVGVLNKLSVNEPDFTAVKPTHENTFPVSITAAQQCPRYVGRVVRNIDVTCPSPLWLQERLRRAGSRSIDCVVDITNYVLLELGQPMHAFDLDKLKGQIDVRLAKADEKIELLDGQTAELKEGTLLIADVSGPIAMAGIMGGQGTAVNAATKNIFFESAFFAPDAILGKAREYGLHTDSSHRFERGIDHALQVKAIERATKLLIEIAGGEAGPLVIEEDKSHLPEARQVTLRRARVISGLGFEIADGEIVDILTRLDLQVVNQDSESWTWSVPSHRFDIAIEEDLLEELARVYGYNNLPVNKLNAQMDMVAHSERTLVLRQIKSELMARDYHEVITYSFISEELAKLFDPGCDPIALANPLNTDLSVMRTSLWPALTNTLVYNLNRQQQRVRLFETGMRFIPVTDGSRFNQQAMVAGLTYGAKVTENWAEQSDAVDFYDLKGDVEALLELTGEPQKYQFTADSCPALHPGQSAAILKGGQKVGHLGALHPEILRKLGIERPVFVFEVEAAAIIGAKLPEFREISKFPEVRRDIALVVDKKLQVSLLLDKVRSVAGDYLENLKVFDLYSGKGIDPQRKSVALGLTYQHPSRTLTESEINGSVDIVVQTLQQEFDATLR